MVDLLEIVIADIFQGGRGNNILGSLYLFIKVYGYIHGDLAVLYLLIIFRHLFLGISQGIICDGEQLRVLPDTFDISGGCLLSVPESLLDEISGVLGFFIII